MKNNRLFGGTLLIAGTTIGAGMLALPVATGVAGFLPALFIFFACWILMYWTATLFLEVNLCFEDEVNLITMARRTLGPIGEGVAWLGFLLLLYSLMAAYMAASAPFVSEIIEDSFGVMAPSWLTPLPIILLFGPFVYVGLRAVDHINRYLMIGLVASYFAMILILTPSVEASRLAHMDLDYALLSFAVVITSFGYHIIIPSLAAYLERDVAAVKKCIVFGSFLPLVIYIIWESLVLGNVPVSGAVSVASLTVTDMSLARVLETLLSSSTIGYGMRAFGLFAIITSFIGVAQSLFDFLRDGFKAPHTTRGRVFIWLMTFVPPFLFVLTFQKGFVAVLEYAGVFVAILIGVVPIMMTWFARYVKKFKSNYQAFGGRTALVVGLLAYVLIIVLAVSKNLGLLNIDVSKYLS